MTFNIYIKKSRKNLAKQFWVNDVGRTKHPKTTQLIWKTMEPVIKAENIIPAIREYIHQDDVNCRTDLIWIVHYYYLFIHHLITFLTCDNLWNLSHWSYVINDCHFHFVWQGGSIVKPKAIWQIMTGKLAECMSSEKHTGNYRMFCCTDTYIRLIEEMVLYVSMFGEVV